MGDTYTLWCMLLSNIALSAACQPVQNNENVTSLHFQASLHQHQERIQAEVKAEENNQRDTLKEQQSILGELVHYLP